MNAAHSGHSHEILRWKILNREMRTTIFKANGITVAIAAFISFLVAALLSLILFVMKLVQ